jgi:hypothetical protein
MINAQQANAARKSPLVRAAITLLTTDAPIWKLHSFLCPESCPDGDCSDRCVVDATRQAALDTAANLIHARR